MEPPGHLRSMTFYDVPGMKLPKQIRISDGHKTFKKNIGEMTGPGEPNHFHSYGSKRGNTLHTRLRLDASSLSAHKFAFGQTLSPQCRCGYKSENTIHFLLHCPQYRNSSHELFQTLSFLLGKDFKHLSKKNQIDLLLNGPQEQTKINSEVAIATQNFILKTHRFYQ